MIAQHAHPRHSHAVRLLDRLLERGRLLDAQSHIQAHEYQQRTGEKRNAPAEIEELRVAQCFRQQQEHAAGADEARSEEHTSELQSLMRISYAVFCLKKKTNYLLSICMRCVSTFFSISLSHQKLPISTCTTLK